MNRYFIKKYCFAGIFLLFILCFSVTNAWLNRETFEELGKQFSEIESMEDLKSWIKEVESETSEEILGRMQFVETYGFTQKILNKHEFNSFSYIKDNDGMLYYGSVLERDTDDLEEYVGNVKRLKDYVESRGGRFLVVLAPSKLLAGVTTVNSSWPLNNPNNRMDKIMYLFQQYGVSAVDLRQVMQNSGSSLGNLFFKTDHHWTPLAAFYGTAEVVRQIKERFGDNWDPTGYYTDLKNYNSFTYPQSFLGSLGRNTGAAYSGLEDYTLLWPECDMQFVWENYEKGKEKRGNYEEALLDGPGLKSVSNMYKSNLGRIYLEEIVDQDKITNLSNPDGPQITVLRDSYFSPMACFLAPMCSEINMLWTRNAGGIDMEEFIKESEFDYVILEVYPYNLDAISFDFFHEVPEGGGE